MTPLPGSPTSLSRMPETVEAVLFDLDGTLLDHDRAAATALRAVVELELGAELEDGHFQSLAQQWRRFERLHYDAYLRGETDLDEQRRRRTADLLGVLELPRREPAELDRWWEAFMLGYRQAWALFDDVRETLTALQCGGFRLGVITNADATLQRGKLTGLGIAGLLPSLTASSEVGVAKPDPGIFAAGCADLGLEPGVVAYVGDRLDVDARGARDAGMRGIWLNRDPDTPSAEDVPTIASLRALYPLLLA